MENLTERGYVFKSHGEHQITTGGRMSDKRFTLEEKIMACWGVVDDLSTVYKNVDYRDKDQVANSLLGLHTLYSMKFEELWQAFEDHLQEQVVVKPLTWDDLVEGANKLNV